MKKYIPCMNCSGAPDHAPGGAFCKVITRVAVQEREISRLYDLLNLRNLQLNESVKISNQLQSVLDSLKTRPHSQGTA